MINKIILFLFIFFTFIPYVNFGLHNPLTNQGELTYYYLTIAIIGLINKRTLKALNNKLLYFLIVPLFFDATYSIYISDFKDAIKDFSLIILTLYIFTIPIHLKTINFIFKTLVFIFSIHLFFTLLSYIYPVQPWANFINFGPQRGDVHTYLTHTQELGKFVRGINTEPGSNINLLLLLFNLIFFIFIVKKTMFFKKVSDFLILANILGNFILFGIVRALRMFIILPINLYYLLLLIKKFFAKYVIVSMVIFYSFLISIPFIIYKIATNPKFNRIIEFFERPIYTIKHDPSIQLHIEKFLGEVAPSGFSVMFLSGHIFLLLYFFFLIYLIIKWLPKKLEFKVPIANIIVVAIFSTLIASYHSPYNIVSLLLIYKILFYIRQHKIYNPANKNEIPQAH